MVKVNPAVVFALLWAAALPLGLLIWWNRRTGAKLWCFLAGAVCFSLFAIGGQVAGLTIEGAEYPLKDAILFGSDSLGVSNQFEEDEVRISFESGHLLVVESRD